MDYNNSCGLRFEVRSKKGLESESFDVLMLFRECVLTLIAYYMIADLRLLRDSKVQKGMVLEDFVC